jgi:cold shock CspA family protein
MATERGHVCDARHLRTKGFGFISPDCGGANIFFHLSGDGNENAQRLARGQAVTYVSSSNTKGPCAIHVSAATSSAHPMAADEDAAEDNEEPAAWLQYLEQDRLLHSILDASKSDVSRQRIEHFRAAQTLSSTARGTSDRDASRYVAAAERFQVSQLERQRAGLETNTRKEHSKDLAEAIVSAHEKALLEMLSSEDKLTVESLCKVHALLCTGLNVKEPGRLRSITVHVGEDANCSLEGSLRDIDRNSPDIWCNRQAQVLQARKHQAAPGRCKCL